MEQKTAFNSNGGVRQQVLKVMVETDNIFFNSGERQNILTVNMGKDNFDLKASVDYCEDPARSWENSKFYFPSHSTD